MGAVKRQPFPQSNDHRDPFAEVFSKLAKTLLVDLAEKNNNRA
jgi:hypothetical protein